MPASDLAAMWIPRAPAPPPPQPPSQLRVPSARDLPHTYDSWPPFPIVRKDCDYHVLLVHDGTPAGLHLAQFFYDDLGRRGVSAWYEDATAASKCAGGIVLLTGNCHRSVALAAAVQKLRELERPLCLVASQGWRWPVCGPGDFRGPLQALRVLFDRSMACPARVRRADVCFYDVERRPRYNIDMMVRDLAQFFQFSHHGQRRAGDFVSPQEMREFMDRCLKNQQSIMDHNERLMHNMNRCFTEMKTLLLENQVNILAVTRHILNIQQSDMPIFFIMKPEQCDADHGPNSFTEWCGHYCRTVTRKAGLSMRYHMYVIDQTPTCLGRELTSEDDPTLGQPPHDAIKIDLPGKNLIKLAPILWVMSKLLVIACGVSKFAGIPLPTKCLTSMGISKRKLRRMSDVFSRQ